MHKIMVVNAGSSSLKFQLLNMKNQFEEAPEVLIEGNYERIGIANPFVKFKYLKNGAKLPVELQLDIKNHAEAVAHLMNILQEYEIIKSLDEISGVGHRVVHGGTRLVDSVQITDEVVDELKAVIDFAPLHNPAHLMGIECFREALPGVFQILVPDTSFHQTMPEESFMYAVPHHWYDDYKIRKYGFHGTSHKYVAQQAANFLGKPIESLRIITAHIGNGGSLCAVKHGKCVDTSMGFTPLDGIVMGSRSGTIDPAVLGFVAKKEGKDVFKLIDILNKESGYKGLTGLTDARDVHDLANIEITEATPIEEAKKIHNARLVLKLQEKKIADYISSYYGYMGGCDAIVFTAGIGEKSPITRLNVCSRLEEAFGVVVRYEKNNIKPSVVTEVSEPESKVKVLVIPTNEELMIARDVVRLKDSN